jgi:hypothetical protein
VHELRGVPDAKHWMPIVAELNRDVRVVPPEQGVQNCCDMVAGKPDIILKWILSLRERGAAT